jgi:hypothetical protein
MPTAASVGVAEWLQRSLQNTVIPQGKRTRDFYRKLATVTGSVVPVRESGTPSCIPAGGITTFSRLDPRRLRSVPVGRIFKHAYASASGHNLCKL